ncbi:MAG: SusF/SusE family outer membrane protein, partial [Muribaculaceae bacterium]|nr:SusF/SusE family outer membrane protein [Muribaculaceae bacterium]
LDQNLRYVSSYDACVAIKLLKYNSGFSVMTDATEVTFTVADDVLSLQGTGFSDVSLAGVWTDDGTIQNYGDFGSVYTPYTANLDLVVLPDGLTPIELPLSAKFFASISSQGEEVSGTAKVARDGDTFYFQGLLQELPNAWLKGELANGTVTIPITYVGTLDGTNVWACGYSSSAPTPIKFTYDEGLNTFECDGYVMLNPNELSMAVNELLGYYQAMYIGERPNPVTPPEGLQTVAMPYEGYLYDGSSSTKTSGMVNIGLDGTDFYIQGLVPEVPEGWLVGVFDAQNGSVLIPTGQYVGACDYGSVFAVGQSEVDGEDVIDDIRFTYDADRNVYTMQNIMYSSQKRNEVYYYSATYDVIIGSLCDEMWIASQQGYENQEEVTETQIGTGVTGLFAQGDAPSLVPKYFTSGEAVRMYAGNNLTISSAKLMSKIIISFASNASDAQKRLEANVGEYELDDTDGTWTGEHDEVVFSVPNESGAQARITKIQIFYFDYSSTVVEVPDDLEVDTYMFEANDTYSNDPVSREIKVGFKDNYVYFQGFSSYLSDAWVRGTMVPVNAGSGDGAPKRIGSGTYAVSIPNWSLGEYSFWSANYTFVFSGAEMTYDAEADKFTCPEGFQSLDEDNYAWDEYDNVVITKINEIEATPADPSVTDFVALNVTYPRVELNIPVVDTDGNTMITDKLSYVLLVEKESGVEELTLAADLYKYLDEDMTEIPYGFSDNFDIYEGGNPVYLNQDVETEMKTWRKIGVQSIYRGKGVEHRSNIGWYDLRPYWGLVDDMYNVGTFCDWDPEEAELMEIDDDGKYTITMEFDANTEFKLITANDWSDENTFGGVDDNNVNFFKVDDFLGGNITMVHPGANFRIEAAGEYQIVADAENMTLVVTGLNIPITDIVVPEAVTIDLGGQTYQIEAEVVPATATEGLVYQSSDEDVLTVDENGLVTAVKSGTWEIVLHAPGIKEVQPATATVNVSAASDSPDRVNKDITFTVTNPTGVKNININKPVAGVQYVNAAGLVSDKPFEGMNIVITTYNDGSRVIEKVVK